MPDTTAPLPEIPHDQLTTPPDPPEHPAKRWRYRAVWAEEGFVIVARFQPEYRTTGLTEALRSVTAVVDFDHKRPIGGGWCQPQQLLRVGFCVVTVATVEQRYELFLMRAADAPSVFIELAVKAIEAAPDEVAGADLGPPQVTPADLPALTSDVGLHIDHVRQGYGDDTLQGKSNQHIGGGWHPLRTTTVDGANAIPPSGRETWVPMAPQFPCPDGDDAAVENDVVNVLGANPVAPSLCERTQASMDAVRAEVDEIYATHPDAATRPVEVHDKLDSLLRQYERLELDKQLCAALSESAPTAGDVLIGIETVLSASNDEFAPDSLGIAMTRSGEDLANEFPGELDRCQRYSVLIRYLESILEMHDAQLGGARDDAYGSDSTYLHLPTDGRPIESEPGPNAPPGWAAAYVLSQQIAETKRLIRWATAQREHCANAQVYPLMPTVPGVVIGPDLVGLPLTPSEIDEVVRRLLEHDAPTPVPPPASFPGTPGGAGETRPSPHRAVDGPRGVADGDIVTDPQSLLDKLIQLARQYWFVPAGVLVAIIAAAVIVLRPGGDSSTVSTDTGAPAATDRAAEPPPADEPAPTPPPADEPDPTPPPEEPSEPAPAPEPEPEPESEPFALDLDDPFVAELVEETVSLMEASGIDVDLEDEDTVFFIRQVVTDRIVDEARFELGVEEPNLEVAPAIDGSSSTVVDASQEYVDRKDNNSAFPCGGVTDTYRVTCPLDAGILPAGEYVVVTVVLEDPIEANSAATQVYGLFFDDDGDDSDNFGFVPPFDESFIRNTEHWYQLQIDPDGTRTMWVDGYRDGVPGVPRYSSAAVIEFESGLVWFIPRSEVPGDALAYRASAFATTGDPTLPPDPSESGGDATGASASEPLLAIDTSAPIVVDDPSGLPPDIDGTQPRVPVEADPDAQIAAALFAEVAERINSALASGDVEQVVALLHPQFATGPAEAACRAEIEASLAQANSVTFTVVPSAPDLSGPIPFYVAEATISYPTGDVAWGPVFLPGPTGRLYLVLPACAQEGG